MIPSLQRNLHVILPPTLGNVIIQEINKFKNHNSYFILRIIMKIPHLRPEVEQSPISWLG